MKDFIITKIDEIAFLTVSPDEILWLTGILDSITVVELAVEIENEFNIKIPIEEINEDNFQSVNSLMSYIEEKQKAK